jgi:hypothetical protein
VDAPARRWAWTIVEPEQEVECDQEERWCFAWPQDVEIYQVWEAATDPTTAPRFLLEVPLRRESDGVPRFEHGVIVQRGWTTDGVSAALEHWAAMHAGREDLHFFWDDIADPLAPHPRHDFVLTDDTDSPLLRRLREAVDRDGETADILGRILDEL